MYFFQILCTSYVFLSEFLLSCWVTCLRVDKVLIPESLLNEAITKAELNIIKLREEIDMNCIKLIKPNAVSLVLLSACKTHSFKVISMPVTSVGMGKNKDSQGYIIKNGKTRYLAIHI